MAITRRHPKNGSTIMHFDHGVQFTSWAFGQLELLDSRSWATRAELANAIFEWLVVQPQATPLKYLECSARGTMKQPTPGPTRIIDSTPSVSGLRGQPQSTPEPCSAFAADNAGPDLGETASDAGARLRTALDSLITTTV